MTQRDKADLFHKLHLPGDPLILFNAWDAGSAKAVAEAGAKAIATGSWSVAAAQAYPDGEAIPFSFVIANLERIVGATDLPVSLDLEKGYGKDSNGVRRSVAAVIAAGAIGCNLEDSRPGGAGLLDTSEQVERLRGARAAADEAGIPFFINARVDLFLRTPAERHDDDLLREALERASAYVEAGGSGIFVPGLAHEALIDRFCAHCPGPVNIMAAPGVPPAARLAALGVARVSHGPWPYRQVMEFLAAQARSVYGG